MGLNSIAMFIFDFSTLICDYILEYITSNLNNFINYVNQMDLKYDFVYLYNSRDNFNNH